MEGPRVLQHREFDCGQGPGSVRRVVYGVHWLLWTVENVSRFRIPRLYHPNEARPRHPPGQQATFERLRERSEAKIKGSTLEAESILNRATHGDD